MNTKRLKQFKQFERTAFRITEGIGSTTSIIVHTILFVAIFVLAIFGISLNSILLILTTAVSLEAIYLAIFIQMTVNRNTQSLEEVEEDIDEIQKDVDEIQVDIDEVQKDVDEIQGDVGEIEKDVDEIQKDIDEVQEDVEDITKEETAEEAAARKTRESLDNIENTLGKLIEEIEKIKRQK